MNRMAITYVRDKDAAREIDLAGGAWLPDASDSSTVFCSPDTQVIWRRGVLTAYGPDVDIQVAAVKSFTVLGGV